jgi:S-layer homology domain
MKVTIELGRPALPRRPRTRRLAISGALLALLVPASVLASHIFTDVPTTMSGHAAIEAVYDARITGGCTPTTYCPTAPVTREQMAIFLQRALPRIAGSQDLVPLQLTADETEQNRVTLKVGGVSGGTQFVKADVSFTADVADATGCPCTIYVYITTSTGESSEGTIVGVDADGFESGNATLTFDAPTNGTVVIKATALIDGPGDVSLFTDISAISGAFGSLGTDVATVAHRTGKRGH